MHSSQWHKSSYSGSGDNCVEVAEGAEVVRVRDTQHRSLGHLEFALEEWVVFLNTLKTGQV